MKFITRIKDKKLNEIANSPFQSKADEPEEAPITILTIDQLIANTKSEGFDQLFSKQNQAPSGGITAEPKYNFDLGTSASPINTTPNGQLQFNLGGSSSVTPTNTLQNQTLQTGNSQFSLPKAPEKPSTSLGFDMFDSLGTKNTTQTSDQSSANTFKFNRTVVKPPGSNKQNDGLDFGLGDLTSLGASKPMQNQNLGKSNYNALDSLGLNDGMSSTSNSNNLGFGTGLSNGNSLASGAGMAGLNNQTDKNRNTNDPFSRGMGGLFMNDAVSGINTNSSTDPFAGLLGSSFMITQVTTRPQQITVVKLQWARDLTAWDRVHQED